MSSKFDSVRKTIKKKKQNIHIKYIVLVFMLLVLAVFSGIKFEEQKQNSLHRLGSKYVHDISVLNDIIVSKNKDIEEIRDILDSLPLGNPTTNDSTTITSYYGYRLIFDSIPNFHQGLDIKMKYGEPIIAVGDGEVYFVGYDNNLGNYVIIKHIFNQKTVYGHMKKYIVINRQQVSKGDTIGFCGTTGRSSGPHVHYEIIIGGNKVNPLKYLKYKY